MCLPKLYVFIKTHYIKNTCLIVKGNKWNISRSAEDPTYSSCKRWFCFIEFCYKWQQICSSFCITVLAVDVYFVHIESF